MTKFFEELEILKSAYDAKLANESKDAIKDKFKTCFNNNPRLESIIWTQYTMYFNDGEPTYFNVYEFDVFVKDAPDDEYSSDEYHYGETSWQLSKLGDPEINKLLKDVGELQNLSQDVYKKVFDDHVMIKATREGFEVSEFNHD